MEIELKKVGIQYLEGEALENIFPGYNELIESIQMCRMRKMKEHYHYNFMYDNVFSIMGKRGTGKTSVIYTLRENLPKMTRTHSDLRMPIITPDVITRNEGIMDWILAVVGEEISESEQEIGNALENALMRKSSKYNYITEKGKELRKIYEKLLEYNFSVRYNARNATSFYEVVDNSARSTRNSYQLMQEMGRFWNTYVDYIKRIDESNENPLIFFFFDDIDLAPEKVEELLTIIRTFLAHPNVIVLITADEEMFLEVVENQLDRKMGRYQKDLREFLNRFIIVQNSGDYEEDWLIWNPKGSAAGQAGDPLKDIARMYLGKVMPPSTRYYLTVFDHIDKKKSFICNIKETSQNLMWTLVTQVSDFVGNQRSSDNFLRYGGKDIDFYLYFIGNTARQIGNAVWIIKNFIDSLAGLNSKMGEQRVISKTYTSVRHFLHSSIIANHRLAGEIHNIEDFVDNLFRVRYNGDYFFVDYNFLNWYMKKQAEVEQQEDIDYETGFQLYALAFFTENIVKIVERKCIRNTRRRTRGVSYFVDFIGRCDVNKGLFRKNTSISEFLYHYGELLTKFKKLKLSDNTEEDILGEYMYTLSKVEKIGTFDRFISEWCIKEEEWLREITGMLFLYYENVYRLDGKRIYGSLYRLDIRGRYAYKIKISSYFEDVLNSCLMDIDLLEKAKGINVFLRKITEKDIQRFIQDWMESKKKNYQQPNFKNGFVSDRLIMPELKGFGLGCWNEKQFLSWLHGLLHFGIIEDEKDYTELINNESSWIRIFARLQWEFEKYNKVSQNIGISNKERLRGYYEALGEYRNGFYAQDLERTAKVIFDSKDQCCSVASAQPFIKLVEDIYVNAERGSRHASEAFRENYTVYMDICKKILKLFDLSINDSDAGYEQEHIVLLNVNYAIEIYRLTQILYYSLIIMGEEDSTEEKKNNYYRSLYEYIRDEIITGKRGDEDLREKLMGYIVEGKIRYIRRVLSRIDS